MAKLLSQLNYNRRQALSRLCKRQHINYEESKWKPQQTRWLNTITGTHSLAYPFDGKSNLCIFSPSQRLDAVNQSSAHKYRVNRVKNSRAWCTCHSIRFKNYTKSHSFPFGNKFEWKTSNSAIFIALVHEAWSFAVACGAHKYKIRICCQCNSLIPSSVSRSNIDRREHTNTHDTPIHNLLNWLECDIQPKTIRLIKCVLCVQAHYTAESSKMREAEVFSHLCKFLAEEINARTDLSREWDTSNQFFVFECVWLTSGQSRIGSVRWAAPTYGYNHNYTLSSIYYTFLCGQTKDVYRTSQERKFYSKWLRECVLFGSNAFVSAAFDSMRQINSQMKLDNSLAE